MRTLLLLLMGPVVFALGYGALPLAVFLAAVSYRLELFPDPDQRLACRSCGTLVAADIASRRSR